MTIPVILASGSQSRAQLLRKAGVLCDVIVPRIDEETVKKSLLAEAARPRDIADKLAEMKACKISRKHPGALVIGCDQVLDHQGNILSKPASPDQALEQLARLSGGTHELLSAAVIAENGTPVWRHVGRVVMKMRPLSPAYLESYVSRNWDSIRHAVGAYKLEEEGARLFRVIDGGYFDVLGIPLIEVLGYLGIREAIET